MTYTQSVDEIGHPSPVIGQGGLSTTPLVDQFPANKFWVLHQLPQGEQQRSGSEHPHPPLGNTGGADEHNGDEQEQQGATLQALRWADRRRRRAAGSPRRSGMPAPAGPDAGARNDLTGKYCLVALTPVRTPGDQPGAVALPGHARGSGQPSGPPARVPRLVGQVRWQPPRVHHRRQTTAGAQAGRPEQGRKSWQRSQHSTPSRVGVDFGDSARGRALRCPVQPSEPRSPRAYIHRAHPPLETPEGARAPRPPSAIADRTRWPRPAAATLPRLPRRVHHSAAGCAVRSALRLRVAPPRGPAVS